MNSFRRLITCITVASACSYTYAQTLITVKAFSNPYMTSSAPWEYVIDAKTTAPFSCSGTNTSAIRFRTGFVQSWDAPVGTPIGSYQGAGNANFIMLSEVISAAKNIKTIELVNRSYNAGQLVCEVTRFAVRVQ